jgi:hypothetical protein
MTVSFGAGTIQRGEITADSAIALPIGGELYFESIQVTTAGLRDGLEAVPELATFDGVLLSVHFAGTVGYAVDGSAALNAPGVALCATHVIEPHLEALRDGRSGCLCMGPSKSGLQIWRVKTVTCVPRTDVTILGLVCTSALPADRKFRQWTLTTRLPKIGERLTLTGFRPTRAVVSTDGGLHCHGNIIASVGAVTQTYPAGRDTVMMPWAAVEVDCAALGAMSGGPTYDGDGRLVGLVCSSFSVESGAQSPAYVSLLWGSLAYPFSGGWPEGLLQGTRSLLQLDPRMCSIVGRDAIAVTGEGSTLAWRHLGDDTPLAPAPGDLAPLP